jgi:hypothetical protein
MSTTPGKIRVTCPACGYRLRAPANRAGARGRCPKCGAQIEIPRSVTPESTADELPVADEAPEQPEGVQANPEVDDAVARKWNAEVKRLQTRRKQQQKLAPRSRRKLWAVLALLAVLLAAGAGAAVWFATTNDTETPNRGGGSEPDPAP